MLLAFFLSFLTSLPAQAFLVVSDVDDTLKITDSGDPAQGAWNGVFRKRVFAGMPELYQAWSNAGAKIHFVTASPTVLESRIESLLKTFKIEYESLKLRGNLLESKFDYKVRVIKRILEQNPEEPVILIGDDVGQDPEVFVELQKRFPERVLRSYIRPVGLRPLDPSMLRYITAYDVALTERGDQRLAEQDVTLIAEKTLDATASRLFPAFAWCPTELDGVLVATDNADEEIARRVEERIESICRARSSEIEKLP